MKAASADGPVAILGLGLIGGSIARDLAARGVRVFGFDRDRRRAVAARRAGAIGLVMHEDLEQLRDARTVILAVPVDAAAELLTRVAPLLARARLITDVGSTKRAIVARAESLGLGARFVGSHPLAGDHRSGWAASRSALFRGATRVPLSDSNVLRPPRFVAPARSGGPSARADRGGGECARRRGRVHESRAAPRVGRAGVHALARGAPGFGARHRRPRRHPPGCELPGDVERHRRGERAQRHARPRRPARPPPARPGRRRARRCGCHSRPVHGRRNVGARATGSYGIVIARAAKKSSTPPKNAKLCDQPALPWNSGMRFDAPT